MCDELQIYKFCFHQFVLPVFAMIFLTAQKREKKNHRSMTDYPETHRKSPETGRGGFRRFLLKYGFCKKLLLSECNSDQLNISWPFLSSLLREFGVALLLHPPKSDDKNDQCSTDQSCIRKEVTSYKIHTLVWSINFTIF